MNAVIGMADALVHNCKDPEILPKLSLIQNSAEKVVDMVDETLVHTKLAEDAIELNLRKSSPADLVRQVCAKWETKAQARHTNLTCTIHNSVPDTITFDEFRYEQCLNNLLSNALKFSQGGNVNVILTTAGTADNRQLVLAVRDTGIGMTEASLEKIFIPFKQADKTISSRYGGTGLGLSIVKDLIELMGGRVTVKSEPNKGTLFAISLPLEAEETKPNESASDSLVDQLLDQDRPKDGPYSKLRVLIVDDNATNHIVVSSLLSNLVGDITTALNGEEALARLDEQKFDIVLMDIHMPVMDGIETTLAIRSTESSYQNVPIIALTADPQYQQSRLCRNIGMNSSLAKPIKLAGLLEAFDELLHSQSNGVASAA
jgi:CheY-like chemotaxis protein